MVSGAEAASASGCNADCAGEAAGVLEALPVVVGMSVAMAGDFESSSRDLSQLMSSSSSSPNNGGRAGEGCVTLLRLMLSVTVTPALSSKKLVTRLRILVFEEPSELDSDDAAAGMPPAPSGASIARGDVGNRLSTSWPSVLPATTTTDACAFLRQLVPLLLPPCSNSGAELAPVSEALVAAIRRGDATGERAFGFSSSVAVASTAMVGTAADAPSALLLPAGVLAGRATGRSSFKSAESGVTLESVPSCDTTSTWNTPSSLSVSC